MVVGRWSVACLAALSWNASLHAQGTGSEVVAPTVRVTAPRVITPLPGVVIDRSQTSVNVQSATSKEISDSRATSITDFMNSNMQSVSVNDYQGNPFRQDLNFRGFSASPLIGTPQGMSIYVDGVRINEPFGDVVNWDLIPMNAIRRMDLLPGSNPMFGLNTLGGALSIGTKSGFTDRGMEGRYLTGSWGRRQAQASVGGNNGVLGGFLALNSLDENGWRANSPSSVKQAFAKATLRAGPAEVNVSAMHADNRLVGNGMVPTELYRENPTAVFSSPDESLNKLTHLNLQGALDVTETTSVSLLTYRRDLTQRSVNGDFYDEWDQAANGRTGLCPPPFDVNSTFPDGAAEVNAPGCPGVAPNGMFNFGQSDQLARGMALQLSRLMEQGQVVAGITYDRADVQFSQRQRLGWIGPEREVYLDPASYATLGLTPLVTDVVRNNLTGSNRSLGVFLLGLWTPRPTLSLTLGARYNRSRVTNYLRSDRPIPLYQFTDTLANRLRERCGAQNGDIRARYYCTEGDYIYESFNPMLGLSYLPRPELNLYGNMSFGSRVPSAIELGCARDRRAEQQFQGQNNGLLPGCSIPTALSSDPYLPQVRSRTLELGFRGELESRSLSWNAAFFRTDLTDDILFVSLGRRNRGVFDTFGETRRQGVELGLDGRWGRHVFRMSYTRLEATFESSAQLVNASNSTADRAVGQVREFDVQPGDRIPGIPRDSLRLQWTSTLTERFSLGMTMIAHGFAYSRGNENNDHQPGGTDSDGSLLTDRNGNTVVSPGRAFTGLGRTGGYAIVNLNADWRIDPQWSLFARIDNVFDRSYATAGDLGINPFAPSRWGMRDGTGFNYNSFDWTHSQFIGPGAPRAVWVGATFSFMPRGGGA